MKCIDRNAIVWIRVNPCSSNGCIVNRKNLDGLLVCLFCPIYKLFQVTEITHSIAAFASELEHGNGCTCNFAVHGGELYFCFFGMEDFTFA